MTPESAIRRFLVQLEADGTSPLTVRIYRGELERFRLWLGKRSLSRVQPDTLARYLTSPTALTTPTGARRSVRTINRTRTTLRRFFDYLESCGSIHRSPARVLRNARADRPTPIVLTDREIKQFLHALDAAAGDPVGERDRVLFTVLLDSGMRLSAALALDVHHLDLRGNVAHTTGKHGRSQRVFLPRHVTRLLRAHLRATKTKAGPVFRSNRDRRLSPRQAQYRFHALAELAGIDRAVTLHVLRHSFATRLRRRTGDLRVVQAALGHRNLSTTEVYAHVDDAEVMRAIVA